MYSFQNDLPDSLFSTAEMSDDYESKFASLVHSRDSFLPHPNPLMKYCHYSNSDPQTFSKIFMCLLPCTDSFSVCVF